MNDLVTSLLREFVQKGVGVVALWLAGHGLDVPTSVTDWAVLTGIAAGLWLWTAVVRFLETRPADTATGRLARKVARWLMLGIKAKPVYEPDPAAAPKA